MMRRDYILEQIEQFAAALANMLGHAQTANWEQAAGATGAEFQRLVGVDADGALQLSDTELLARLIQGGPSQIVESKIFMLATLFKMSGDVLAGQGNLEAGDRHYLKGLQLLLYHPGLMALEARPDFVPTVAAFLSALGNSAIPVPTLARLMRHYEQEGEFAKAEDALFALADAGQPGGELPHLGETFYQRILSQSDETLIGGNLPRAEAYRGLADFRARIKNA